MHILSDTDTTITMITGSAVSTDYVVDYVDHSTTSFSPLAGRGNVATATTTTILAAPESGKTRQVKSIKITNRHASSTQTVQVFVVASATSYALSENIALAAGQCVLLNDKGWTIMSDQDQVVVATGKLLTVDNTLKFVGTDGTVMTFPATNATIARSDAANTFAGNQTFSGRVIIDSTTDATTTTDGGLQTDSGLSVAKNTVIGGGINEITGYLEEVAEKNRKNVLLKLNGANILHRQYQYWTGSSWSGDSGSYFYGDLAGYNNAGSTCVGIGKYALQSNSGHHTVGLGFSAAQNSTGTLCVAIGGYAGQNNTGGYSNGIGYQSLTANSSIHCNGFGYVALAYNIGQYSNCMGSYCGYYNTGSSCNSVGYKNNFFNQGNYTTTIGNESNTTFKDNTGAAKTFAYTDVNTNDDTITITAHGFGSIGTWVNLRYNAGAATSITGLATSSVYQFYIVDANTVALKLGSRITGDMTAVVGTGSDLKLTPQYVYSGCTIIGNGLEPDASNQIIIGTQSNTPRIKFDGSYWNLYAPTKITSSSTAQCNFYGYSSEDVGSTHPQFNGEITLGSAAIYQGKISYAGGKVGYEHMYYDNTYDAVSRGHIFRVRTSGTPIESLKIMNNVVNIPITTESTSTTTGCLVLAKGLGVGGNANIGGDINIASGKVYKVNETQVLTARQAAIADSSAPDATDLATAITLVNELKSKLNTALAMLRTHGLIAT